MARTMQTYKKARKTGGVKRNANLHAAIRKGGTDFVKKLLNNPDIDVNATDKQKVRNFLHAK